MDGKKQYYFRLSLLSSFLYGQIRTLLCACGSEEEFCRLKPAELSELGLRLTESQERELLEAQSPGKAERLLSVMRTENTEFLTIEEDGFPELLREIPYPPFWLFVRGALPPPGEDCVAVIGSRRCSPYGREMADFFGRELAGNGIHIVSGMATGVDGYAQRGALKAQERDPRAGRTLAVLGGGTDICYPRENIDLFTALLSDGNGLLSERPPGYYARAYDFPRRNRLISGLCRAVLVIEAAEKSGTIITVNAALDQNREVFSLPGRVSDRMSRGCNDLLRSGAHVLTCPEDVLQFLGKKVGEDTRKSQRAALSPEEKRVYGLLSLTPVSVDELLTLTGLPAGILLELLVRLEIKGVIKKSGISGYLRAL